jgi:hypothetical protein
VEPDEKKNRTKWKGFADAYALTEGIGQNADGNLKKKNITYSQYFSPPH